jgi:hypothetical protein
MSLIKVKVRGQESVGRRNIIINGAMQLAQRGTSSTTSGYQTADRFTNTFGTAAFTQTIDATVPAGLGFSSSYKHECTTASSATGAFFGIQQSIEAQNIRNSGWDYTSANSFVTLSFYARSSVAGTYLCGLRTVDGTAYNISSQYTLAANTWKRVIVSFPGNPNLTINNDNGLGLKVFPMLELGSDYTAGSTFDAWTAHGGSTQTPDVAINIHDTVNSTFFITGVQLEVGNSASDFEHRSVGEELSLCQRYCYQHMAANGGGGGNSTEDMVCTAACYDTNTAYGAISLPVTMRAAPTIDSHGGTNYWKFYNTGGVDTFNTFAIINATTTSVQIYNNQHIGISAGDAGNFQGGHTDNYIRFIAEL